MNGLVQALAQATVTAAHARIAALAQAGVTLDLNAFATAQASALANFNVGLDAVLSGKTSFDAVTAQLAAAVDAALQASGAVSASARVQAQAAVSVRASRRR